MTRKEQISHQGRRLRRQIDALTRNSPRLRRWAHSILHGRLRYIRLPLGLLLIASGFLGFLPVLGFWMIPLGLLLIAIDIPALRPAISSALVRLRRCLRKALGPNGRLSWLGRRLGREP